MVSNKTCSYSAKKHLIMSMMVFIVVAVLWTATWVVKNKESNQTTKEDINLKREVYQKATAEVVMSSDSSGFGVIQLDGDEQYSCYLFEGSSCVYAINDNMKLVAVPAEASVFESWISGCDNISDTNTPGDTCEINAHDLKKMIEVKFIKAQ